MSIVDNATDLANELKDRKKTGNSRNLSEDEASAIESMLSVLYLHAGQRFGSFWLTYERITTA